MSYKIVVVPNSKGVIKTNHKKKEILVSKDIKVHKTDDGKFCATFPNFRPYTPPLSFHMYGYSIPIQKHPKTDCSIIIEEPSNFEHCVQKDGVYQLSGSKVTFNGSNNDDTLILNRCEDSHINMNGGNDNVLYRENRVINNNIDLGDGDNTFTASQKSYADSILIKNKITSGNGNDNIFIRTASHNEISTGAGKDLVTIEGAPTYTGSSFFRNNLIDTQKGNDSVNIFGNFNDFSNNGFYLGKGSNKFNASINPQDDAKTVSDYNNKLLRYTDTVSNNRIYATDGKKGFFEKNSFTSTTHTANQFSEYVSTKATSEGFQDIKTKPVPQSTYKVEAEQNTPKKLTGEEIRKKCAIRYQINSLGAMLFKDTKMQEEAFRALDDYVNSMLLD